MKVVIECLDHANARLEYIKKARVEELADLEKKRQIRNSRIQMCFIWLSITILSFVAATAMKWVIWLWFCALVTTVTYFCMWWDDQGKIDKHKYWGSTEEEKKIQAEIALFRKLLAKADLDENGEEKGPF